MSPTITLSTSFLLLLTPVFFFSYFISSFIRLLVLQYLSPLRILNGPPSPSMFMGNLAEMHDQENNNLVARWESLYGSTFVYRGFIGGRRLMTIDPVAVAHVLGHAYDYPKPDFVRDSLATMVGGHDGLLTVEGSTHQRQVPQNIGEFTLDIPHFAENASRANLVPLSGVDPSAISITPSRPCPSYLYFVLISPSRQAPAFSASHIKSLTPIFWAKATELRDIWLHTADSRPGPVPPRIDALSWLARATLDVIGLAGFGYTFNSLISDRDELAEAFSIIFSTARKFRVMTILQVWFPILRRFRRNSTAMTQAQQTMHRIGTGLIEEKKRGFLSEKGVPMSAIDGDKSLLGRDLLSVLIRSNLAAAPSQCMSTEEVLSQISTFLAAGHETTSSAMTWCLYALTQNPKVQRKLRQVLIELDADMEACEGEGGEARQRELTERISRCEYLDWVIRESLRVHAPVTNTMRVCMRDEDEIPVSQCDYGQQGPGGGYLDREGNRRWSIRIKKWDIISIPIQAINKSQALWGEDAQVFRRVISITYF
ncbi:cytochrome P450 [Pluteus cervinus]|uniref:Cytochrome P450 n=1 Tax=Pluteus cervinus TaxID=181527 RepID=A0ACD3AZK2_9AGAR|nr:cytochrome P450 [Pluteus cervinus]